MVFRPTFPNCPGAGSVKAAVLNHSPTVGLAIATGKPVAFARMLTLLPRATSVKLPSTLAVTGVADAKVHDPLNCQSPNNVFNNEFWARKGLFVPKGSSML